MWRLAAWTGMRRGELAGLTWRDVDLEAATITRAAGARHRHRAPTCARASRRRRKGRRQVELDEETSAALAAWQERQQAEREEWERTRRARGPTHGLVFTLQDGAALHPDYLSRAFRAHAKRAKLPTIRLHDLRHTHATLMLAAGVPVKVVSETARALHVAFTMEVTSTSCRAISARPCRTSPTRRRRPPGISRFDQARSRTHGRDENLHEVRRDEAHHDGVLVLLQGQTAGPVSRMSQDSGAEKYQQTRPVPLPLGNEQASERSGIKAVRLGVLLDKP